MIDAGNAGRPRLVDFGLARFLKQGDGEPTPFELRRMRSVTKRLLCAL